MSEKDGSGSDDKENDKKGITDMMRELALSGLATFFMTEDTIRSYLKEMKLPKELVSILMDGVGKKKDDFYGLMVKEFGKVLSKVDITKEVSRFLENHRINVEAKVSFEPKNGTSNIVSDEKKGSV